MKRLLACVLVCCSAAATAAELYRWTDPETGKMVAAPALPPYPVKEKQAGGSLPSGEVIKLILDENSPQYKAAVAKRKTEEEKASKIEAEKKRLEDEKIKKESDERADNEAREERMAAFRKRDCAGPLVFGTRLGMNENEVGFCSGRFHPDGE
ncbi:MAG TPA: DUF4124 domain-containing protein, partial [Candidatus Competibacter sp.]|nr:DUF4124 domain-containing protein [Candidatus Competibacter sp.]